MLLNIKQQKELVKLERKIHDQKNKILHNVHAHSIIFTPTIVGENSKLQVENKCNFMDEALVDYVGGICI